MIRPLRVHSDERIQAMLLVNMIALLVYSLLERQAEQYGLCLTARKIIERLSTLQVQLIEAWDGSQTYSWIETADGQVLLLTAILQMLDEMPRTTLTTDLLTRYLLPDGLPAQGDTPPTRLAQPALAGRGICARKPPRPPNALYVSISNIQVM